jgi:hypothetical protein
MTHVRDEAIADWDMIIEGKMKDAVSQRIARAVEKRPEHKALIHELIPQIVDTTLHHLLWTLEQDDSLELQVHDDSGETTNVADESDGLAGDLYDWLPRFSKQRYPNPADSA